MMILAGDIGATKTHVALFEEKGAKIVRQEKFHSAEFPNLSNIVHRFLGAERLKIQSACFGIAGPVEKGVCRATNLPWVVDAQALSKDLGIARVWLINDLEANAYGLKCLKPDEFHVLNAGALQEGHGALISAGTGLGEAGLFWNGKELTPFASEGGHVDFAPRDELEVELWRYLHQKFKHVSYERVIAGPGIHNLYQFLIDSGKEREKAEIKQRLASEDPPKVITDAALTRTCPVCVRTLSWFVSLYGSAAGNLALKFLAVSGVYLGGGIAPKILEFLKEGEFMRAFCAKGRFAPLLSRIPVKVVLNENTALLGAASFARARH